MDKEEIETLAPGFLDNAKTGERLIDRWGLCGVIAVDSVEKAKNRSMSRILLDLKELKRRSDFSKVKTSRRLQKEGSIIK